MENNAMIYLKTIQNIEENEESDEIELQTKGVFAKKNGKYYVIYEESELTGFEDTTTTIKVSDEEVVMTRRGKFNSRMLFRLGEKCLCSYPTPYGVIPIGVNPVSIENNLNEDGGNIAIEYILDIDNRDYFTNRLNLSVTKTVS